MTYQPTKKYKQHTANLRAVDEAFKEAVAVARSAIRDQKNDLEEAQSKLCGLLLGVWAETRLSKLLNEQNFFADDERDRYFGIDNLFDRWTAVLEHGFRKHYRARQLSEASLGHGAFHQFCTLRQHLEFHIKPILEIRNKLAHGQWIYPFASNSPNGEVVQEKYLALKNINIHSLNLQYLILKHLSDLIFLLLANKTAFQRDFDNSYSKISDQVRRLESQSYQTYRNKIIQRSQQGGAHNSGQRSAPTSA